MNTSQSKRRFLFAAVRHTVAAVCCLSLIGLAGCTEKAAQDTDTTASTAGTSAPGGGGGGGKQLKLAFVTNNSSDFWTIAHKGCDKADEELANAGVDFKIPSNGTAAEQKQIVDTLLADGVDGIAISPVDPTNQTDFLNDTAAKCVLVTQDSDAPNSNRACYVGTDNVAAGRQAGDLIKEALPGGGKIMLFVGKLDAQNAQDRKKGIEEALQGTNIQILDTRTDNADRVRAKSNAVETMVKYPDIACMVGLWSYNGPAILNAVKDANKVGKVKIVCFDEEDETLAGVKSGQIFGTIVQQPYEFGYQSIKLMAAVAGGDKSAIPADKMKIIPTLMIKQAEVSDFKTKLDQLRGRS